MSIISYYFPTVFKYFSLALLRNYHVGRQKLTHLCYLECRMSVNIDFMAMDNRSILDLYTLCNYRTVM